MNYQIYYILVGLLSFIHVADSHHFVGKDRPQNDTWTEISPRDENSGTIKVEPRQIQQGNSQDWKAIGYLATCNVGGQPFQMLFDTGSSSFWLASTLLPQSDRGDLVTYNVIPERIDCDISRFEFKYADGLHVSASAFQDEVVFADLTIKNFIFGAASSIKGSPLYKDQSGIIGMSFDLPGTWLATAARLNSINSFTVDLGPSGKNEITFDAGAQTAGTNINTLWLPLIAAGKRGISSWKVNSESHGTVLFDTGASGILLTSEYWEAYIAHIGTDKVEKYGTRGYVVKCDTDLPDFDIKFGDEEYYIEGHDLLYAKAPDKPGYCTLDVTPNTVNVVGLRFIETYLVTFDVKNERIGITERA